MGSGVNWQYSLDNTGAIWDNSFLSNRTTNVCYGNGKFVVLSADPGAGYVPYAVSSDNGGRTWTSARLPAGFWNGICYGNGMFVAVGSVTADVYTSLATIAYSYDGINWTSVNNTIIRGLTAIAYGDGMFMAVGARAVAAYSNNGINWANWASLPGTNQNTRWDSICYGNGMFIAASNNTARLVRSNLTSGFWINIALPAVSGITYRSICYGNGMFVGAGTRNANGVRDFTSYSYDGVYWNYSYPNTLWNRFDIAYGNGRFLAVTLNYPHISYSYNGEDWGVWQNVLLNPNGGTYTSIAYGGS